MTLAMGVAISKGWTNLLNECVLRKQFNIL